MRRLALILGIAATSLACNSQPPGVLSVVSTENGATVREHAVLENGAESVIIDAPAGWQRVLVDVQTYAGFVVTGSDSRGVLPAGAIAVADEAGNYLTLHETAGGTVAVDIPPGYYWLTATNTEPLTFHVIANSANTTTYVAPGSQQTARGTGWARLMGRLLKKAASLGATAGCGAVLEWLKNEEGVVCWNVPSYLPIGACVTALFGCPLEGSDR